MGKSGPSASKITPVRMKEPDMGEDVVMALRKKSTIPILPRGQGGDTNRRTTAMNLLDVSLIRGLSASIAHKRRLRNDVLGGRLSSQPKQLMLRLIQQQQKVTKKLMQGANDAFKRLELWGTALKSIEDNFGAGVASYFIFLRTLFALNVTTALIWIVFLVAPKASLPSSQIAQTNVTLLGGANQTVCKGMMGSLRGNEPKCSAAYRQYISNISSPHAVSDAYLYIKDTIDGQGWMEASLVFYGSYPHTKVRLFGWASVDFLQGYNFPLAYMAAVGAYMMCSIFVLAGTTAEGLKNLVVRSETFFDACEMIFSSWDFRITNSEYRRTKHAAIYSEICSYIVTIKEKEYLRSQSLPKILEKYAVRTVVNILVLAMLGAGGYSIYMATTYSTQNSQRFTGTLQLLVSFIPPATLTALNMVLPQIFYQMSKLEHLSPAIKVRVDIIRCVFVRLASLAVLITTLYNQVKCAEYDYIAKDDCNIIINASLTCPQFHCWESSVGQHFHQLVFMELFLLLFATIFVDVPSIILGKKCGCQKLIDKTFSVPTNVLDLVYCQALLWLGTFFSPTIPAIMVVHHVLLFYVRKIELMSLCKPNRDLHRVANSSAFFMTILLISFVLSCLPLAYIIIKIPPSTGCGPFRGFDIMFDVIPYTVCSFPEASREALRIVSSAVVVVPMTTLLCLVLYYQCIIAKGHRNNARVLRYQLLIESQAKVLLSQQLRSISLTTSPSAAFGVSSHGVAEAVSAKKQQARCLFEAAVIPKQQEKPGMDT